MMALLNDELSILYISYDELLLSGMVHLLDGGVYLMNLLLLSIFCDYGFEGLVY